MRLMTFSSQRLDRARESFPTFLKATRLLETERSPQMLSRLRMRSTQKLETLPKSVLNWEWVTRVCSLADLWFAPCPLPVRPVTLHQLTPVWLAPRTVAGLWFTQLLPQLSSPSCRTPLTM